MNSVAHILFDESEKMSLGGALITTHHDTLSTQKPLLLTQLDEDVESNTEEESD